MHWRNSFIVNNSDKKTVLKRVDQGLKDLMTVQKFNIKNMTVNWNLNHVLID